MACKGIYILGDFAFDAIYSPAERADIAALIDIEPNALSPSPQLLADGRRDQVDVILSGWGAPRLDEAFLDAVPKLKALFYGAGAAGGIVTEASWRRGVRVTTAYEANAVPVAQYALGAILLSLKHAWKSIVSSRADQKRPDR